MPPLAHTHAWMASPRRLPVSRARKRSATLTAGVHPPFPHAPWCNSSLKQLISCCRRCGALALAGRRLLARAAAGRPVPVPPPVLLPLPALLLALPPVPAHQSPTLAYTARARLLVLLTIPPLLRPLFAPSSAVCRPGTDPPVHPRFLAVAQDASVSAPPTSQLSGSIAHTRRSTGGIAWHAAPPTWPCLLEAPCRLHRPARSSCQG